MKYIPSIKCIKKVKMQKINNKKERVIIVKFAKGLLIGGMITTGLLLMYNESDMLTKGKKKIMKKGKQVAKKMGMM